MSFDKLLNIKPTMEQIELLKNEEYDKYYSIYGVDIYGFQKYNKEYKSKFLNYIEYIYIILSHFIYLENNCHYKNMNYYNNIEFDSNITWFEYLGNKNYLGIKTNLNHFLAEFLLNIYNAIFNINPYLLNYYFECFDDENYTIETIIQNMNNLYHKTNDNNYSQKNNCYYLTINQIIDILNYKILI